MKKSRLITILVTIFAIVVYVSLPFLGKIEGGDNLPLIGSLALLILGLVALFFVNLKMG